MHLSLRQFGVEWSDCIQHWGVSSETKPMTDTTSARKSERLLLTLCIGITEVVVCLPHTHTHTRKRDGVGRRNAVQAISASCSRSG